MPNTGTKKNWTILSLIQWSETYLAEKGIESPRLNAEQMLAAALGCKRIDLYTRFDKPLVQEELDVYKKLFLRRLNREPLQYILGSAEFYGRRFSVRPGVLIPRPETEHLVESAMEVLREQEIKSPRILDIGTGSGCVAVTLAAEIEDALIVAVDNSEDALAVARENAVVYSMNGRVDFKNVNILDPDTTLPRGGTFHIVVANPPYIPKNEWEELPDEIKVHEPKSALTDDSDGLKYLKRLAELAPDILEKNGWLLCEVGYDQAENVQMFFQSSGAREVRCWKDLSGINRIVGGIW